MSSSQVFSAVSRPFELHQSALSEEEYDYYMGAVSEILEHDLDDRFNSANRQEPRDVSIEDTVVTLSEVRAWLRGRFPSVDSRMVDKILRLVPAPPTSCKMVRGGQFFAVLRMIFHVVDGMSEIDVHRTFLAAPVTSSPFLVDRSSRCAALGQADTTEPDPTKMTRDRSEVIGNKVSSLSQGPKPNGTKKTMSKTIAPLPSKPRARTKAAPSELKLIPAKRRRTVESEDDDDQDEEPADTDHGAGENSRRQTRGRKPMDAYPCPPPDKDGYFTVADIHGSKTSSTGAIQLYVSWQGYPLSECSWEPLAALKHTDAYRHWQQMWDRIKREKGLKDIQIVPDRKRFEVVNGQKQELRLVQEVGTKAKDGTWMPLKEAQAMLAAVKHAIEDDTVDLA